MLVYDQVLHNLVEKGIIPSKEFNITPEILTAYLSEYIFCSNTKGLLKRKDARYAIKLAALTLLKYKRSLNYKLTEGFTYIISNSAWDNYYKIGMSSFPKERLAAFQTYSPYRDYKLHHWSFWFDKRKGESYIHSLHNMEHEWVYLDSDDLSDVHNKMHYLSGSEDVLNSVYF